MNDLRSAAKFVEFSQNHEGEGFQSHFSIKDNFMKGSNGILTIGCRCDVNFAAFPESLKLIAVLSKCGKDFSVKLKDKKRLEIKTDKILAFVPCLPSEEHLLQIDPDLPICDVDDKLKTSLGSIAHIPRESDDREMFNGVFIDSGSCYATDGTVIAESYHGLHLPRLLIPKKVAMLIAKTNKPLTKLGFSDSSATFYFEDDSYIQTQMLIDDFIDIKDKLTCNMDPENVPDNFFNAINAVLPFSSGWLYMTESYIGTSKPEDEEGMSYSINGPVGLIKFSGKSMKLVEKITQKVAFGPNSMYTFFENGSIKIRSRIMYRRL